jgi:hypothetical protein
MNRTLAPHRVRIVAALLALLLAIPGCYTYHVYQIGGPREGGSQPGTEWREKTLHALAWGGVRQDIPVDNCRLGTGQRLGIEEVNVRTNFGYTLITAVTLGFWSPVKVRWRCARPPVRVDTLRTGSGR